MPIYHPHASRALLPTGPDRAHPAAALAFAILGTTVAAVSVVRLATVLSAARPLRHAPEAASLVWEG